MPSGRSGCASLLQSSVARVSPMPTARPSPAGCGGTRTGGVVAGGSDSPPRPARSPLRSRIDTRAGPPRGAAMIRATGSRRSDRRDLLVLGDPEGRATAARGHDVRVVHLEAGTLKRVHVVDARAVHVREALVVDEDAQAMVLEDRVAVALVVEGEVVLEAGAASAA